MNRLEPAEIATRVSVSLPERVRPRETARLRCVVTNLGRRELRWSHPHPVALGFRWVDAETGTVVSDDERTLLPRAIRPGESLTLDSAVNTPWAAGRYELRVSPVQEFVAWFEDLDPANGTRVAVELSVPDQQFGPTAPPHP